MTQNISLEIKVVEKFIIKNKRDRYIQFLSSPKARKKFIKDIGHPGVFDMELFDKVQGAEDDFIIDRLNNLKIDSSYCYIISENANIDTMRLEIKKAFGATICYDMPSILVFGNAEAIFMEYEGLNNRYMSK
jgi:hypothetical protein